MGRWLDLVWREVTRTPLFVAFLPSAESSAEVGSLKSLYRTWATSLEEYILNCLPANLHASSSSSSILDWRIFLCLMHSDWKASSGHQHNSIILFLF